MKKLDLSGKGYGTPVAFFPLLLFNVILCLPSFFTWKKKEALHHDDIHTLM